MIEDAYVQATDNDQQTQMQKVDHVGHEVQLELTLDQFNFRYVVVLHGYYPRAGLVGLVHIIGDKIVRLT